MAVCKYPMSMAAPLLILFVTGLLLAMNLSGPGGLNGYGMNAGSYVWHPVMMCIAFLLLQPLGIILYSIDLGAAGNAALPSRASRRLLHAVLQASAAGLGLAGYVWAYLYHEAKGKDHLALKRQSLARPIHVFLGLFAVFGSLLLACVGAVKLHYARSAGGPPPPKALALHGRLGPLVWVSALLAIALAAVFEYQENLGVDEPSPKVQHWTLGQAALVCAALLALAASVVGQLACGSREHLVEDAEAAAEDKYSALRPNELLE